MTTRNVFPSALSGTLRTFIHHSRNGSLFLAAYRKMTWYIDVLRLTWVS